MPLTPGLRLGPYEITGAVGKGGMGEVYRARDTRLERDVAIKVLPAALVNDPQFRARFEREAKSVSALNHPHICTLHDVGQQVVGSETVHYLVMEMIEGESLADRIDRGPLSLEEVLRWGAQIASGLDAAHRRGIVHRDLKPGNVMITKAGAKLVDFGLAKTGGSGATSGMSALDTVEAEERPITEQGTVMGTFQYMSPEQLEGLPADARADIFALGALLYEMATGKKAFEGKNRTSLIAAIVSKQPPSISSVQGMSPPALDHVVRKCLEKDPDDRWQSAHDVKTELEWIEEGSSKVGVPTVVAVKRRHREGIAWAAAAVLAIAASAFAVAWVRRAPVPQPIVRFVIPTPEGLSAAGTPAVSPDGRVIAFDAVDATGQRQIWIRPVDTVEARPLPGTEGAQVPIWSPDSRLIAFRADGKLRKVPVAGGPAQTICDAPTASDGTWNANGVILFDGTRDSDPIWKVDAAGGVATIEVSTDSAKGIELVGWPEFLPDGRHYLYMSGPASDLTLMVRALGESEGKPLFKNSSRVLYSRLGYLLYVREQTLVAQPFDADTQAVTGEPVPVGEGLGVDNVGGAAFSLSTGGVLVYRSGEQIGRRLVWMDRRGKESAALEDTRGYADAWLSPDGGRLVFDMAEVGVKGDLWIRDLARGVTSRFTFDPEREFAPIWSPDGRSIVYTKDTGTTLDLYVKDAAGTGEAKVLLASTQRKVPSDWSKDGRYLVYSETGKDTGWDLWALPMTGDNRTPIALNTARFSEVGGSLSPDGKYLAYRSNESGRYQVYVQEFPEARSKWQVSVNGGADPFWKGDGRELYYRAPDLSIMAVPVQAGASFSTGTPETLFRARFSLVNARGLYRVTPDGQRFLVLTTPGRDVIPPATVVLNWTAGLQ